MANPLEEELFFPFPLHQYNLCTNIQHLFKDWSYTYVQRASNKFLDQILMLHMLVQKLERKNEALKLCLHFCSTSSMGK